MAQNPFPLPSGGVSHARTDFDISYRSLLSSPASMILPVYCEDVSAGDFISLDMKNVTRMQGVNTAAFVGFDEKIDFFFVPYRLLCQFYPQMKVGAAVQWSSLAPKTVSHAYPSITRNNLNTILASSKDKKDVFGYPLVPSMQRLLDLLGYGVNKPLRSSDSDSEYSKLMPGSTLGLSKSVTLWRILAYQCIYQHYYRNPDFEEFDPSFNIDERINSGGVFTLPSSWGTWLPKMLEPRYKNWRKDLFSSVKPYNGISSIGSTNLTLRNTLKSVGVDVDSTKTNVENTMDNEFGSYVQFTVDNSKVQIGADSMRALMHMDAFTRRAIMSDKTYSSLMSSLYGVDDSLRDTPIYLGTHNSAINISEVVGTSAGESGENQSYLGQIGGRGLGSDAGSIFSKQFDEDGVILGLHYISPYNNYGSQRVSKMNTHISRYDQPIPDFDNLGLSPVYRYEYYMPSETDSKPDEIIGFNTRYHEYKTRQDEIHGEFVSDGSLRGWTIQNNNEKSFDNTQSSMMKMFKIKPSIVNQVMKVEYDGYVGSDPFLCWFDFNVKRSSNISRTGLPNNGI